MWRLRRRLACGELEIALAFKLLICEACEARPGPAILLLWLLRLLYMRLFRCLMAAIDGAWLQEFSSRAEQGEATHLFAGGIKYPAQAD